MSLQERRRPEGRFLNPGVKKTDFRGKVLRTNLFGLLGELKEKKK